MQAYKHKVANALTCMIVMAMSLVTIVGQPENNRRVKVLQGRIPTVINAKIVEWSYDNYVIRVRAGQKLTVRIASEDKSAYFMVIPTNDKGRTLNPPKGAAEWTGAVPRTGDYMIHVGSVKGNASYTLELALK